MPEWSRFQTQKRAWRPRCCWRNLAFSMNDRTAPLAPGPEQDDRAEDRHDESSRMKRRARCWPRKEPPDQTAQDGSANTEKRRHDKAQVLHTRHNRACAQADNETDMIDQMMCNMGAMLSGRPAQKLSF